MHKNARKGWISALFALLVSGGLSFIFKYNMMASPKVAKPFFEVDVQKILFVAIPLALAIFVGGLLIKSIMTRKAIVEKDRKLVVKGLIYGIQASILIGMIGFGLAVGFWFPLFYLWHILGFLSLCFSYPRLGAFLDASY